MVHMKYRSRGGRARAEAFEAASRMETIFGNIDQRIFLLPWHEAGYGDMNTDETKSYHWAWDQQVIAKRNKAYGHKGIRKANYSY